MQPRNQRMMTFRTSNADPEISHSPCSKKRCRIIYSPDLGDRVSCVTGPERRPAAQTAAGLYVRQLDPWKTNQGIGDAQKSCILFSDSENAWSFLFAISEEGLSLAFVKGHSPRQTHVFHSGESSGRETRRIAFQGEAYLQTGQRPFSITRPQMGQS